MAVQLRGHCIIQTGRMDGENGEWGTGRKDEMREEKWGWKWGFVWSDLWIEIVWLVEGGGADGCAI